MYINAPGIKESDIAIIQDGATATQNITAGSYIIRHNSSEKGSLYKAASDISSGTTFTSSLLTPVADGALNEDVPWSKISSKPSTFTPTTGTTATTAAAGNHTHTLYFAHSDDNINGVTLAINKKYSITSCGSSYIFTTPPYKLVTYSYQYSAIAAGSEVAITGTALGITSATGTAGAGYTPLGITKFSGGSDNVMVRFFNVQAYGSSTVLRLRNLSTSSTNSNWCEITVFYLYTG